MTNYILFNADLAFSGQTLAYMLLGIVAVMIAVIFLIRMQMSKKAESGELTSYYANIPKKSPLDGRNKYGTVDVLRKSGTVFNIGLALSLLFTVLAFSWTNFEKKIFIPDGALEIDEDIEVEPPRTAEPPPPPPPPPPPVIEEVPEEEMIDEEEPEFASTEIDEEDEVEYESEEPIEEEEEPEVVEVEEEPEEEKIFKVVEDMPRFPGCEGKGLGKAELKKCAEGEMLQFIYKNIKYPAVARENGIEGKAVLRFMVDKDGSVRNIEILRDPGGGTGKEAKRVVEKMNSMGAKWIPGKQRGKAVKVFYTLPVSFKLQG